MERLALNGQWILGPQLPNIIFTFGIAPIDNSHVLIPGGSSRKWLRDVKVLNINIGNWTTVAHFPTRTVGTGCEKHSLLNGTAIVLCVGGKTYVTNDNRPFSALSGVYNIAKGSWSLVPEWNLPVACFVPNIQSVARRLFIFGGEFEDDQRERVLEFKEDSTPVWQELDPLPARNVLTIPFKISVLYPNKIH